ncbi:M15 family metallopeptidase [Nonomuraea sp. N2-4H]|jgi:D-alanyl-D-alanine dipeptidase|uniref:M15 family metallopeptidase n=1 Tax=unclassified Nonomuraea TaxID=2593643 RepID=UPI00325056EC
MWQSPNDVVLISDSRVTSIPVKESGEPLVDVRGRLRVDDRLADDQGAYAHLRAGVLQRLEHAESLLPAGYHLLIVEGYRPVATQRKIFDDYRATLTGLTPEESYVAASRYVSPVEVAPHTAGAAVDLTLCSPDGTEYDMGTQVNDNPEQSEGACYTAAPNISDDARAHRKLLGAALEAAGLVNYPTEWWHWSYGDRYWAMTTKAAHALYGPVEFTP